MDALEPMDNAAGEYEDTARELAEKVMAGIRRICRQLPARAPGSRGERLAAEAFAGQLRQAGCTRVQLESFPLHPQAFYGCFFWALIPELLCCLGFFLRPWLAVIFGAGTLLVMGIHFLLYREALDPLFPRVQSVNLTAIRPCRGRPEGRLLLNAHLDAAWEWPLNYRWGGIVFELQGIMSVLGLVSYTFLGIARLAGAGAWTRRAGLVCLGFLPFWIALALLRDPRRVVDGANDNLSGCCIAVELMKAMADQDRLSEHTELGVVLTGAEECGLRGAKAWCRAHREEFRDVPTYILSFDTIHDPAWLMVNRRDLNGLVRADRELADRFLRAAKAAGVPCRPGWVPPLGGATDAAAFTQGGFRAVSVTGLSHRLERYYHTRRDSWDNLNPLGLRNCLKAALHMIREFDGEKSQFSIPNSQLRGKES